MRTAVAEGRTGNQERAVVSRVILVFDIVACRIYRVRIRFAQFRTLAVVFRAAAPSHAVGQKGTAYETVVTVAEFAFKLSITKELRIVLRIRHTARIADTYRKSVAAQEGFTERSTDVSSLPRNDCMGQVDTTTVQVVIILLEEDELFVRALAGTAEVADVAALVINVEQIIVTQRVAFVPQSVSAVHFRIFNDFFRKLFSTGQHIVYGLVSIGLSRTCPRTCTVTVQIIINRGYVFFPSSFIQKHSCQEGFSGLLADFSFFSIRNVLLYREQRNGLFQIVDDEISHFISAVTWGIQCFITHIGGMVNDGHTAESLQQSEILPCTEEISGTYGSGNGILVAVFFRLLQQNVRSTDMSVYLVPPPV